MAKSRPPAATAVATTIATPAVVTDAATAAAAAAAAEPNEAALEAVEAEIGGVRHVRVSRRPDEKLGLDLKEGGRASRTAGGGHVVVPKVHPGYACDAAAATGELRTGAALVAVNGTPTRGLRVAEVYELMRGQLAACPTAITLSVAARG